MNPQNAHGLAFPFAGHLRGHVTKVTAVCLTRNTGDCSIREYFLFYN